MSALFRGISMQALGLGIVSRRWIAGTGLNAEYDLKKRQQEELLKEQEVTPLTCATERRREPSFRTINIIQNS